MFERDRHFSAAFLRRRLVRCGDNCDEAASAVGPDAISVAFAVELSVDVASFRDDSNAATSDSC